MAIDLKKFNRLFDQIMKIDLAGRGPDRVPFKRNPTLDDIRPLVEANRHMLPVIYQDKYATPLANNLRTVAELLKGNMILETVLGAVYGHADPQAAPQLRRFLAVISDFYRSFLSSKRRARANFPLVEQLPPLAMFQASGQQGPFTVPVNDIQRLCDAKVGVVSLPDTYRDHPALWAALAHEAGGHDVLHADPNLLPELKAGVQAVLGGAGPTASPAPERGRPTRTLPATSNDAPSERALRERNGRADGTPALSGQNIAKLLGLLWAYWMDEAAADVYAVLNMGPSYGLNLAVYFAALNAQHARTQTPSLSTRSHFAHSDPRRALDTHPTDIVRPYLIMGVMDTLTGLSESTRDAYAADLAELAETLAPHARTVTLTGYILGGPGSHNWVETALGLAEMQDAARRVGSYIASARLQSFGGRSIQQLETWDDADEDAARRIASALAAGESVAGMGDDAQVMAGTTLALYQKPESYAEITELLAAALDFSFDDDPLWGRATFRPVFLREESPDSAEEEKKIKRQKAKGKSEDQAQAKSKGGRGRVVTRKAEGRD